MAAARPLLVAQDADLADEVSRLAAASGTELDRCGQPALPAWRSAPVVLLDPIGAAVCAANGLPRRDGVLVLCREPGPDLWQVAFQLGAQQVLELPAGEAELIALLTDATERPARDGRVLAVLGGCGGAGASTLATATALVAARSGTPSLLVDCDPLGGGVDLALGAEEVAGLRWSGLAVNAGRLGSAALHEALPRRPLGSAELALLACDRDGPSTGLTPWAVRAVLNAGRRAGDVVVCDLPRSVPEPAVAALRAAELVVIVVPAQVRACAAAARVVTAVREHAGKVCLVVRGPAPGGLRPADVRQVVGADVLAVMRSQLSLPAAADRGDLVAAVRGRSPLVAAAKAVLTELARCEYGVPATGR